ncbi:DnaJ C-terminal domain-containing protein [Legionella hackeliae]|uniref:Curved DNA-binding protein n=1 Tax=Legionella hackeliae TaxID=449 RepID=A0A0A8URF7_LEGHA|nr:DnaJ C-terminal domain-containing protein [Legionella hackeliae]KTD15180.1 DNA-binding protein DnaJ [Legionella hackeliae]CEK11455.1 Curved DNA-binding protein [Legionella hackeliae]STX48227.1 DNA-binding protein DnaJ [Legionella hackeliae]
MEYKDYYQIMGLERNATPEDIKRAYRKLARKYHPDVSKEANAEAKFKELGEAYEVLKDPEKKAKYDRYGQYWKEQEQRQNAQGGGQQHYSHHFDEAEMSGFEDFLNSIFKDRFRQEQASFYDQGQDIHAKLNITLEESFYGAEKTLQLQTPIVDQQGRISYETRAVKVKIPKGIGNKQQIRLKGQGGKGTGSQAGDLYIEIDFSHHPWFHLHKKDIHLNLPISPWEAVLGATVKVPTLGGTVNLKIPKLSQSGKKMRLKGRGLPGNPPGDQYVILQIVIPQVENEQANKLFQQLADTISFNPREHLGVNE